MKKKPDKFDFFEMTKDVEKSPSFKYEVAVLEIQEQIAILMKKENITKEELAKRIGKTTGYITRVLRGTVNFDLQTIINIANALNCRVVCKLSPVKKK